MASSREVESRKTEAKIPDINQEPPKLLAADGSLYKRVSNTSVTKSLDVKHLSGVEQLATLKSSWQHDPPFGQPSNRWVKRLKLSASDSLALGTKNSKMGDSPSSQRTNDLFRKIMSYSRSCSDPPLSKPLDEGQVELNRNVVLLKNRGPSGDSLKKNWDLSLSHPWIRRWCRHQAPNQRLKPAETMTCELKHSRNIWDKNQFPSISALALMGKASNCFRPCAFRRKGSVIVWHTESF